jgi:hypothetical protein
MRENRRLASDAPPLAFLLPIRHDISLADASHTPASNSSRHWDLEFVFGCEILRIELLLRCRERDWNRYSGEVLARTPIVHFDIPDTTSFFETEMA